jgi:hypothetical protein
MALWSFVVAFRSAEEVPFPERKATLRGDSGLAPGYVACDARKLNHADIGQNPGQLSRQGVWVYSINVVAPRAGPVKRSSWNLAGIGQSRRHAPLHVP